MTPNPNHSPSRSKPNAKLLRAVGGTAFAILIGIPLSLVLGMGLVWWLMTISSYRTSWEMKFDRFQFHGGRSQASAMTMSIGSLPDQLDVKLEDGTVIHAAELTEDHLHEIFGEPATRATIREKEIAWFEREHVTVETENGRIVEIKVFAPCEIIDRHTGASVRLEAKWSEIRKAFGKPWSVKRRGHFEPFTH